MCRQLLLFRWKEKLPPGFEMWLNDLLHRLVLEKIRYSSRACVQKSHTPWKPFLNYIEELDFTDTGGLYDCIGYISKLIRTIIDWLLTIIILFIYLFIFFIYYHYYIFVCIYIYICRCDLAYLMVQ